MVFTGTGLQNTGDVWPLKPASISVVTKSRDVRFGILALANVSSTDTPSDEYFLMSGGLKPSWVGEGDPAPLVKASSSKVTATAKKLMGAIGFTAELEEDAILDPEKFEREQILPGFAEQLAAALIGRDSAGNDVNIFTRNLADTVTETVAFDETSNAAYRDASAAARAKLVRKGVTPNGAVWNAAAADHVGVARAADGAGETSQLLYRTIDELSGGLRTVIDVNLAEALPVAEGGSAGTYRIGYVGDFDHLALKIYRNLTVKESPVVQDDNGNIQIGAQMDERYFVFSLRASGAVIDADRFIAVTKTVA